mmetsp:Transcript_39976/g.93565  ORF Transcript_39976/g.93565 Transcript_39976/m.93565 type:complete len:215 (+) Transcript_39976:170-814(+)
MALQLLGLHVPGTEGPHGEDVHFRVGSAGRPRHTVPELATLLVAATPGAGTCQVCRGGQGGVAAGKQNHRGRGGKPRAATVVGRILGGWCRAQREVHGRAAGALPAQAGLGRHAARIAAESPGPDLGGFLRLGGATSGLEEPRGSPSAGQEGHPTLAGRGGCERPRHGGHPDQVDQPQFGQGAAILRRLARQSLACREPRRGYHDCAAGGRRQS